MPEYNIQAAARDELERTQGVAAGGADMRQQAHGDRGIGDGHNRGCAGLRARIQLQHGGGDDAQRAFGADEQVLQVVAGIVLAQAAQAVPDTSVRQHHFQPQHQIARIAVAQHAVAAGVGGQVAADLAIVQGCRQLEREQAVMLLCHRTHVGQDATRLDGHGVIYRINGANALHARQVQHDLPACCQGNAPTAQTGVATLRHDCNLA